MHRTSLGHATALALATALAVAAGVPADAQVVTRLTDTKRIDFDSPAWTADDAVLYQVATIDPLGTNPLHAPQAFRWTWPGPVVEQLTAYPSGVEAAVVDGTATVGAVVASVDPFGTNPDLGPELFLTDGDLTPTAQLTTSPQTSRIASPAIARDGSRVAFVAAYDPLGGNPDGGAEVFVVDADGTGLVQVTGGAADATCGAVALDATGGRVGFIADGQFWLADADGTGLTQISDGTSPIAAAGYSPGFIAFAEEALLPADRDLYLTTWSGQTPLPLGTGQRPSVSDGGWVYYLQEVNFVTHLFRTKPGLGATQLTTDVVDAPLVAPQGTRVRLLASVDVPGNEDASTETFVTDGLGAGLTALTQTVDGGLPNQPRLASDGSGVVYLGDFVGNRGPLMRLMMDEGPAENVTAAQQAFEPSGSGDLSTVVFHAWDDLDGQGCAHRQLYRWNADGVIALGSCANPVDPADPVVSADGSTVVYQDNDLYVVPSDGGTPFQLTSDGNSKRKSPRVDATGTWVAYVVQTFGGIPADYEVFRIRTDGTGEQQITDEAGEPSLGPDISADGSRIVFHSSADLTGGNADHNRELFLYEPDTATFTQLTDTTVGRSEDARLSPGGEWVAFLSTSPFFETSELPELELFRLEIAGGTIERAQGLTDPIGRGPEDRDKMNHSIDADGNVAFAATGETDGRNVDGSWEIWLADFGAASRFDIEKTAPAVVSWEPAPQPVSYDLIRGDVANLAHDAGGVTLGTVVCVENDSTDTSTANSPDPAQPAPGQVFFYVFRGPQGSLGGPGSWGEGTGGLERVAAAGSCAD